MTKYRLTFEEYLTELVKITARRSTCSRLSVGAIIIRDTRVISSGYNGAPPGFPHCSHQPGDDAPCSVSTHAEANAIAFAAKSGIRTDGAGILVTHAPCGACSKLIISSGIKAVHWLEPYRNDSGTSALTAAGVATGMGALVYNLGWEPVY